MLYGEVPQMFGTDVFLAIPSLPQIKIIGRGFDGDFCNTTPVGLQAERPSRATKGLKSPGTDRHNWGERSYRLCWHHPPSSGQTEQRATTPLHSGLRLQLLQRPSFGNGVTVPALSTATQNGGRQTKHQTKHKT